MRAPTPTTPCSTHRRSRAARGAPAGVVLAALAWASLVACDPALVPRQHGPLGGGGAGADPGLPTICEPGSQHACYSGPAATLAFGPCKTGVATCAEDGTRYDGCVGEVPPAPTCGLGDDDCDGILGCPAPIVWAHGFVASGDMFPFRVSAGGDHVVVLATLAGDLALPTGAVHGSGVRALFAFDAAGEVQWARVPKYSPGADEIRDIAVSPDGSVWLTGISHIGIDWGEGPLVPSTFAPRAFVAKLDPSGAVVLARGAFPGLALTSSGDLLDVDASGRVLVGGHFEEVLDLGDGPEGPACPGGTLLFALDDAGALQWAAGGDPGNPNPDTLFDVAFLGDGNVAALHLVHPANSSERMRIVARGPAGEPLFSEEMTPEACQIAGGSGELTVAGSFNGAMTLGDETFQGSAEATMFAARLHPSGASGWARVYAKEQYVFSIALTALPGGDVVAGGFFGGNMDLGLGPVLYTGAEDAFLARLGAGGDPVWVQRFGGARRQRVWSLAATPWGDAVAVGTYENGVLEVGGSPLPDTAAAIDERGMWIARFQP